MMNIIFLLLFAMATPAQEARDATGTWKVTDRETRFRMEKVEDGFAVHLGAEHEVYAEYEVHLEPTAHPNGYRGEGYFIARLSGDRECRFETEWQIAIASDVRIVGVITSIVPAPEGCAAKETSQIPLDLRREPER
jgi:hypothetical protein